MDTQNVQHDQTKIQMNVSREADAEFMRQLESEDPKRFASLMQNVRRHNPSAAMSEHQALTNWMLGLPTGQWHFGVVAGHLAPVSKLRAEADRLLHEGTTEEYVAALLALADAPNALEPVALRASCKTNGAAEQRRFTRRRIEKARAGRKAAAARSRAANGVFE
jgi:hypothetical protein